MAIIDLQASIVGFKGLASCVFATMDTDTNVLYIAKEAKQYTNARYNGCLFITSDKLATDFDESFDESFIKEAVNIHHILSSSGRLVINPKFNKLNPSSSIENDGIDMKGRDFRMMPTISNGAIAVLALCWLYDKQFSILSNMSDFDDLFLCQTIGL